MCIGGLSTVVLVFCCIVYVELQLQRASSALNKGSRCLEWCLRILKRSSFTIWRREQVGALKVERKRFRSLQSVSTYRLL